MKTEAGMTAYEVEENKSYIRTQNTTIAFEETKGIFVKRSRRLYIQKIVVLDPLFLMRIRFLSYHHKGCDYREIEVNQHEFLEWKEIPR